VDTTITSAHDLGSGTDARTLDRMVETAEAIDGVWASAVRPGDWIVIRTKNSVYSLAAEEHGRFRVAGGWFLSQRSSDADTDDDQIVRVAGCTWGGAAIHTRVVAAVGMFLEFDNGVRTTRIREVRHIRGGDGRKH
jgi:hypothetical protein